MLQINVIWTLKWGKIYTYPKIIRLCSILSVQAVFSASRPSNPSQQYQQSTLLVMSWLGQRSCQWPFLFFFWFCQPLYRVEQKLWMGYETLTSCYISIFRKNIFFFSSLSWFPYCCCKDHWSVYFFFLLLTPSLSSPKQLCVRFKVSKHQTAHHLIGQLYLDPDWPGQNTNGTMQRVCRQQCYQRFQGSQCLASGKWIDVIRDQAILFVFCSLSPFRSTEYTTQDSSTSSTAALFFITIYQNILDQAKSCILGSIRSNFTQPVEDFLGYESSSPWYFSNKDVLQ